MDSKFSASEAIAFSWDAVTKNLFSFIGIAFIFLLIQFLSAGVSALFKDQPILNILTSILITCFSTLVMIGIFRVCIGVVDGEKFEISDIFNMDVPTMIKVFVVSFLVGLIVFVGILLLIIPGIIWSLQYSFAYLFVIDKEMPIIASIKACGEATYGSKMSIFGLWFLIGIVNLLGLLCFGVGLFVTIPMSYLAIAYAYRSISPASKPTIEPTPAV